VEFYQSKVTIDGLRRGYGLFQSVAFAEGYDIFQGVLKANAICGAVGAENFNSRGGNIRLKAGNVIMFLTSGLHSERLLLL